MTEQQRSVYRRTSNLSGEALAFQLNREGTDLQAAAQSASSGRAGKQLVKEGPLRVTLVGLKPGNTLQEHHVDGPVAIQTLNGQVRVTMENDNVTLPAGHLLVLEAGLKHTLEATEPSQVLLTMAFEGEHPVFNSSDASTQ
jgi:quercetin dioxygenase-like cupin family protein